MPLITRIAFIALSVLFSCRSAYADQEQLGLSDNYIKQTHDWQLQVSVTRMRNYMAYPESRLKPMYELDSRLLQFRDEDGQQLNTKIHYRNYWCTQDKPVGCKTFAPFHLPPGLQGIITFTEQSTGNDCAGAIASVAIRSLLELKMQDQLVDRIVVPGHLIDEVASTMANYGFYAYVPGRATRGSTDLLLTLVADHGGRERRLFFNESRLDLD